MSIILENYFSEYTSRWFKNSIGKPTQVQEEAWPAIASGKDTLVVAPTGTGKTLSSFLVFIDQLKREAREGTLKQELQVIYVSPLKSLAADIRENLRKPMEGIYREEGKDCHGRRDAPYDVQVAIRTGDTTTKERRHMIKTPPHILITTPESLYLLLTSKSGKQMLGTAKAIIIDELHALIDNKRGAHLMLSIARLDQLCKRPLQRIGLSATIQPLDLAADYLSPLGVTLVAPPMEKAIELAITSPFAEHRVVMKDTIWQELASTVYDHCKGTRSVIAFVDGRMYSEKLAYYVNQIAGEGFARTHHGSLSKEQRHEVEEELRNGNLHLLCATSSMELGIDVGEIDRVFQIGCPRTVASTLQRLGRAGHKPGETSVMHIFPRTPSEGLYCGLTAEVVREGEIENSSPPRLCFDVLAQHLVSMATGDGYKVDEVMEILPRAYPFREVTKKDVTDILCMLAGDYEHEQELPVRPRILYDRIHGCVEGDGYSRMLAVSAAGTIPDKGMYTAKTENGIIIGELDEEFVYEARVGNRFMLGTFAWQIINIQKDAVIVRQSSTSGAQMPFWKGDIRGRKLQTGVAFGKLLRNIQEAVDSGEEEILTDHLKALGLDTKAAGGAKDFLLRQIKITGELPNDKTILVEHFRDDTCNHQVMIHSVFGRQINAPLALLLQQEASRKMNTNISYVEDDDGILLFPFNECEIPYGLLEGMSPLTAKSILKALLLTTPLFNITFRYNAAHALMMGTRKHGRQPLWVQRLRSAQMLDSLVHYPEHPLIRETARECLEELWDLPGLILLLQGIQSGEITIREFNTELPSPMSLPLRRSTEAEMMYNYSPMPGGVYRVSEQALQQALLEGQAISPDYELLHQASLRKKLPKDSRQLHSLLMIEGDLIAGELPISIEWLEELVDKELAYYIEPGLWIAAEQVGEYEDAFLSGNMGSRFPIVRRLLRYRGGHTKQQIMERYLWAEEEVTFILETLCDESVVTQKDDYYYHSKIYQMAQQETVRSRRLENQTLPGEQYAAVLLRRIRQQGPTKDQLLSTLQKLCNKPFPAELWETIILPGRVKGYREESLDQILLQGQYFWQFTNKGELMFCNIDEMDWEADYLVQDETLELSDSERVIWEALKKRGASFMKNLSNVLETPLLHMTLLDMAGKGLVHADSFVPVRQWNNRNKIEKGNTRQIVHARVLALTAGRWELTRPIRVRSVEEQIEFLFEQKIIICRETVEGITWQEALAVLRVWEYTGKVRRGYFIEGLSGIQFIKETEFAAILLAFQKEDCEIHWISAIDPAQPWGKCLAHQENRNFLNVPGTVVALRGGIPVAVFEQRGKILRVFEHTNLEDTLRIFIEFYQKKQLYQTVKRIVIKKYPREAEEALKVAGFSKEIQDYVFYR